MKRLLILLVVLGVVLVFSPAAYSTSSVATGSLLVKARVADYCSVSTTNLIFPDYDGAAIDKNDVNPAKVIVRCTDGTKFKIELNDGLAAAPNFRQMEHTTELAKYLKYRLWFDNGLGFSQWRGSSIPPNRTSNGQKHEELIYGDIPLQGTLPGGVYKDTVAVTVTYW